MLRPSHGIVDTSSYLAAVMRRRYAECLMLCAIEYTSNGKKFRITLEVPTSFLLDLAGGLETEEFHVNMIFLF